MTVQRAGQLVLTTTQGRYDMANVLYTTTEMIVTNFELELQCIKSIETISLSPYFTR